MYLVHFLFVCIRFKIVLEHFSPLQMLRKPLLVLYNYLDRSCSIYALNVFVPIFLSTAYKLLIIYYIINTLFNYYFLFALVLRA